MLMSSSISSLHNNFEELNVSELPLFRGIKIYNIWRIEKSKCKLKVLMSAIFGKMQAWKNLKTYESCEAPQS